MSPDNKNIGKDMNPDDMERVVDALYRSHKFISYMTDIDALLEHIMAESKCVAEAEACSLMLFDEMSEQLYFMVTMGESGDQDALKQEIRLNLCDGIAGLAATTREPVNVTDAENDPRIYRAADEAAGFKTKTLLAVPLLDHDKLVGVLEVVNKIDGGVFSQTDIHVMEIFSGLVASVICNARLIEQNMKGQRLAAIGEAIAGLSHYTKNLITGIVASSDLMQQSIERENMATIQRTWPIFKRTTDRVAHFVADMLVYSKPRAIVLEECDLEALLEEAKETLFGMAHLEAFEITFDLTKLSPPVWLDTQAMFRCFVNFFKNSADAIPEKAHGIIKVTADNSNVTELGITIEDNGPGIPPDIAHKIFEPFFSTKGSGGTGLGMAVTHKIISEHGGSIEIERSPLGGALIRILIPQSQDKQIDKE